MKKIVVIALLATILCGCSKEPYTLLSGLELPGSITGTEWNSIGITNGEWVETATYDYSAGSNRWVEKTGHSDGYSINHYLFKEDGSVTRVNHNDYGAPITFTENWQFNSSSSVLKIGSSSYKVVGAEEDTLYLLLLEDKDRMLAVKRI